MRRVQPMPCPVLLGTVTDEGLPDLLHRYTIKKNVAKVEKVLQKGADVNCTNDRGQTPLYCACLLGFASVAEKLLQFGANPNNRSNDGSTPVHAAVFSCNPWLLSSLLDAGGDLRLHDDNGRVPKDWAKEGAQENIPKMLDFLQKCESQMQSLLQTHPSRYAHDTPTSSKTLLSSPGKLKLLQPWRYGLIQENENYKMSAYDMTKHCFGHGKFCFVKPGMSLGLSSSVPLISDSDLVQTTDEPLNSFMCGSFIHLTNYSWKGSRVTVKELHGPAFQKRKRHDGLLDLLIYEQEYCCQLSHPHLLLLMAVSMTSDHKNTKLVYERVNVGSLHSLLHQRRDEFPLPLVDMLSVLLQVCEVLIYLHGRSLVLRALSSHTVLIVYPGFAKVTGLGFMVPSSGTCPYTTPPIPLPLSVINWAAPENITCMEYSEMADLYSMCTLVQEIFTDEVPWGSTKQHLIKLSVQAGQALTAHPAVPEPYYQFLCKGLRHRAQDRTSSLNDLSHHLYCHIREIKSKNRCHSCSAREDDIFVYRQSRIPLTGAWKAVGPPSKTYIPRLIHSDEKAKIDFKRVEATKTKQPQKRDQRSDRVHVQLGLSEVQKEHYQTKATWTSEVSEMAALMTRGCLRRPMGAVDSSDSEDKVEQQRHLLDREDQSSSYSVNSYQESENTELEQLFKSFAGIQSDSEESTHYQTINNTFDLTDGVCSEGEESSDGFDYTQTAEEQSQSLSSEDELDVTVEVCRSSTEGKQAVGNTLRENLPPQEKDSEFLTPVHSCLAEIADISSISYSPSQLQEWVESAKAPPIPNSGGHPTCNSTPRSPKGHRTHLPVGSDQFPHLQSFLDTKPSHTVCTESYATACSGDTSTSSTSVSSILKSPVIKYLSKEETDSPSSANAEFTTASSEARQTPESSQRTSEEMELPADQKNDVDEKEEKVCNDQSDCDLLWEKEPFNKMFDNNGILKKKEGCTDENECQIHDQHVELYSPDSDTNTDYQKSDMSPTLDETERASSTLDEELEKMATGPGDL